MLAQPSTLRAVVSPGWTLCYEGRETTASNRLLLHARPPDAYVRTSNDITFVCFARNNSKTTTLNLQSHLFLYICLPFLYDYDVKMPNSGAPRARAKRARVGGAP